MKIEYRRLSGELAWSGVNTPPDLQPPPDVPAMTRAESEPGSPPHPIDEAYGSATRAVHAGARPDPVTGSRNVPIHQTTSYVFESADQAAALFNLQTFGYIYSRLTNPTVSALEERVAALEGGGPPSPRRPATPPSCWRSTPCWSPATTSWRRASSTAAR